jgi:hypothetical protein
MLPTNHGESSSGIVVSAAKAAIEAGDQSSALALLDGLRWQGADEGRQLTPAVAEALVATASGDTDSERAALVTTLREARKALQQIQEGIEKQPFDAEDLAQIASALSSRRARLESDRTESDEQGAIAGGATRALGAGWLEWRMVSKPSGREFGPYVYRWRESGRKRTKYIGKTAAGR